MHSPRPYIDALYFRTTVRIFFQNLIRNNTPVYIPNYVSGHCYVVNALQTLLLEKLRRKHKFLLRKIMIVGAVNVQFHVNPVKNQQSSS